MDEPFGALDAQTRSEMQELLLRIWDETASTVLFVTHDVEEALLLSRTVVVMSARPGRVLRIIDSEISSEGKTRREIVTSPEFVALKEEALEAIG